MFKTKTLDDITYKDKWYKSGSPIDVDDKDVDKLVRQGAIDPKHGAFVEQILKKAKVKINVIKNPVKAEKPITDGYGLDTEEETKKKLEEKFKETKTGKLNYGTDFQVGSKEEKKRIKRKRNKRDRTFRKRR